MTGLFRGISGMVVIGLANIIFGSFGIYVPVGMNLVNLLSLPFLEFRESSPCMALDSGRYFIDIYLRQREKGDRLR